jgi:hypothetical protein
VYPEGIEHELGWYEADQRVQALDKRKYHFRLWVDKRHGGEKHGGEKK